MVCGDAAENVEGDPDSVVAVERQDVDAHGLRVDGCVEELCGVRLFIPWSCELLQNRHTVHAAAAAAVFTAAAF